jgi:hypothetical protein
MFIAAWSFDVQYGMRDEAVRTLKETTKLVEGTGWRSKRSRILSGSIGAPESRFVIEHEFDSLADLEASWQALHTKAEDFKRMVAQMKHFVVSGSPRWEIYRVLDV